MNLQNKMEQLHIICLTKIANGSITFKPNVEKDTLKLWLDMSIKHSNLEAKAVIEKLIENTK